MATTLLFVIEKEYSTERLKGEHDSAYLWIDERVFSDSDPHADGEGEPLTAKEAAKAELVRLRDADRPEYIRGYRLVQRTIKATDKVLDAE